MGIRVVFRKERHSREKGSRVTMLNSHYSVVDRRKKKDVWVAKCKGAGRLEYSLTCFRASSLKQAFASEMDEVRVAENLRLCLWCDYPTDFLYITSSEPLHRSLAAEQSNSPGLCNLSGCTGALTTGTCSSAACARHTWGLCIGIAGCTFVFCLPAAHDSRRFLH